MSHGPRIVIVGGGISGLVAAYRLEQFLPGAEVTVLESEPRVGGKVCTNDRDGFRIERGPNGFLDNKPHLLNLCAELGLAERLLPASDTSARNRFLFLHNQLHKLPTSFWSFLRSKTLSLPGKINLLFERVRPRRYDTADESIEAFVRRRAGREVAETLADAFVAGIFAGDPAQLSVQACLPRLVALERDHGSVMAGFAAARRRRVAEAAARGQPPPARSQQMWSFREGLGLVIDTLRARLRRPPLLGVAVKRLHPLPEAKVWQVHAVGQDHWTADAVLLTCPAYQQAALLADSDTALAALLDDIAYTPVVVVAMGFRAADIPGPLDGFGYLTPQRDRRDVLGVQWCSSIFSDRAPPGCVLLRAFTGGWNRRDIVAWDDERLLHAVRAELAVTMGVHAMPVFQDIQRWERAIPQYRVGHLDHVAKIEERVQAHPRLYLGGNSFRGVALNDCVEQAEAVARRLAAELTH